jgi:tRNA modification GTPase
MAGERLADLAGTRLAPGSFGRVVLRDRTGELLDEAIAWVEPQRVEIHVHGAPVVVERVVRELGAAPAPERAGTLEELAEARLASAWTEAAARILLDQAEGALRREFATLALLPEDERLPAARSLARRARACRWILEPPRVVLAGPANAGKSTLFNVLVGGERAVVDPAAGTTRDPLCERVLLGEIGVELFDTAGVRTDASAREECLERAGQELAEDLRRGADVVLWLQPAGTEARFAPPEGAVVLRSRSDLATGGTGLEPLAISALCAPEDARRKVESAVRRALAVGDAPFPGAGVPFEQEWIRTLERADPDELGPRITAWLGAAGD